MRQYWETICKVEDLVAGSGISALVNGEQVAVFYLPDLAPSIFAIANHDPISGANVLSRGIVGDMKGELVVASPVFKQHFSLMTGKCLETADIVPVFDVRVQRGLIQIAIAEQAVAAA